MTRGSATTLAVISAPGAPGRTSIAANLAVVAARSGKKVLLIDLDVQSPALRFVFGITGAASGLAAAMRLVGQGRLDLEQLQRILQLNEIRPRGLSLLTGLARDSLLEEVTAQRVNAVIELARQDFELLVIDTAALPSTAQLGIEPQTVSAEVLRASITSADTTILLGEPSLVGVSRLIEAASVARDLGATRLLVALNRVRPGLHSVREVEVALSDTAGFGIDVVIQDDRFAFDLAQTEGSPMALRRRRSPAAEGVRRLFAAVTNIDDG